MCPSKREGQRKQEMALEPLVATIYADKPSQLTALGFKEHAIATHPASSWGPSEPFYSVSAEFAPFEYTASEAYRLAYKFLDKAKTKGGKNREGLDTDISHRCDYSPCYD